MGGAHECFGDVSDKCPTGFTPDNNQNIDIQ